MVLHGKVLQQAASECPGVRDVGLVETQATKVIRNSGDWCALYSQSSMPSGFVEHFFKNVPRIIMTSPIKFVSDLF